MFSSHRFTHIAKAVVVLCTTLTAFTLLVIGRVAADVITIKESEESTSGTYFYPVDVNRNFIPGYFYAPTDDYVTFTIMAIDGATLHIFSDAAGSTELSVPATLRRAGQAQSEGDGSFRQQGDVYLTQGWHKCHVEYTLLTPRSGTYCELNYSTGVLYDKVQSVSAICEYTEWDGAGPYTSSMTLTITTPEGNPAAGDSIAWYIDKVTTDIAGDNPISPHYMSISSNSISDGDGQAQATIQYNPPGGYTQDYYIWVKAVDTSRWDVIEASSPSRSASLSIELTPGAEGNPPIGPPSPIQPAPPNRRKPVVVNQVTNSNVGNLYISGTGGVWLHRTQYQLRVRDNFNDRYSLGYPREAFEAIQWNPALKAELIKNGAPGKPVTVPIKTADFRDVNAGGLSRSTGANTHWFTITQRFYINEPDIKTSKYKLNTHTVRHVEQIAERVAPIDPQGP